MGRKDRVHSATRPPVKLEQPSRLLVPIPAINQQLAPSSRPAAPAHRVVDSELLELKAREDLPDGRVVVDANNGLALERTHHCCHPRSIALPAATFGTTSPVPSRASPSSTRRMPASVVARCQPGHSASWRTSLPME